jgi:DNA polymerase bacteriophage-type
MKKILSVDIETYSDVDLRKCGVYKYVESQNFSVLLIGYAIDDKEVKIIDVANGESTENFKNLLLNNEYIKTAWNANFERVCLSKFFGLKLTGFDCTQFRALNLGLHARLDTTAKALKLEQQKIHTTLINWWCVPDLSGNMRSIEKSPEKWEEFKQYCKQDVEVERAIRKCIGIKPIEKKLYDLDAEINARGIKIDLLLVRQAIALNDKLKKETMLQLKKLMGIENPNSDAQFKIWLNSQGVKSESIDKESVDLLLEQELPVVVRQALKLRKNLKNTAVKKYDAMLRSNCKDGKIRGLFQCYGANRTGRWAGRLVQVQNLYRNKAENLDEIREFTKSGNDPREKYGADALSQLIRTAFIAESTFNVLDFSAIEARILAWMANEKWVIDVFSGDGKIYEAQAAAMFGLKKEDIKKDSPERSRGKTAVLACGYQGALGALRRMGAEGTDQELLEIVRLWRQSRPKTVQMWHDIEDIVKRVVKFGGVVKAYQCTFLRHYEGNNGWLFIQLPSGRRLAYYKPFVKNNSLWYWGNNLGQWTVIETYGGKLVENCVQAIARDCLVVAMHRLQKFKIVMHCHDEIVIDSEDCLKDMRSAFENPIPWAPGLVLKAEGFQNLYYKK